MKRYGRSFSQIIAKAFYEMPMVGGKFFARRVVSCNRRPRFLFGVSSASDCCTEICTGGACRVISVFGREQSGTSTNPTALQNRQRGTCDQSRKQTFSVSDRESTFENA